MQNVQGRYHLCLLSINYTVSCHPIPDMKAGRPEIGVVSLTRLINHQKFPLFQ